MGFLKPDVPEAPPALDINEMLREQGRQNRTDTIGPYGSSTWSEGPDGRFTQTNVMSEQLQPLYNAQIDYQMRGPGAFSYGSNPGAEMYGRLGMPPPSSTGGGMSYNNPVGGRGGPPPQGGGMMPAPPPGSRPPMRGGRSMGVPQAPPPPQQRVPLPQTNQGNPFQMGQNPLMGQQQMPPALIDFLRNQRP